MATINLSYCNSSFGESIDIQYNDVTHQIISGAVGASCGTGVPANTSIYQQVDGDTLYTVYTQNSEPYAYVSSVSIPACIITIDSVAVGNASNENSVDGSIIVTASGPYAKTYSKNDGLNYQSSNTFTGLTRGSYPIRVRSHHPDGSYCYDTDIVVVGFNAIANCSLELGNITKTSPTTIGGSDGTITVNTVVDPLGLTVEYRIGAGAWQDSPVFTGLGDGTHSVQVRYKNYTSCSDSRDVTLIDEGIDCDILISDVIITHEQSKFAGDGRIVIIATGSHGPYEYSIDDGDNYQEEDLFQDLEPGTYQVRVKDAANCEDSRTIVVKTFKAPYFDFPIVNGLRFVVTSGPGINTSIQNFDNTLFHNMRAPGVEPGCYDIPRQQNDLENIQWRSSYTNHTLQILNASDDSLEETLPVEKVRDFIRQTESISALIADAGAGKTQVFFESGLPEWAKIGQDITLSDTGEEELDGLTFEIEDIVPGVLAAAGNVVLIISVAYPVVGILSGTVDAEYDIEPFNVFEAVIPWGDLAVGRYYLLLQGTDDQFEDVTAESEPAHLATTHKDTVLLRWSNTDNAFKIFYDTGIEFMMRVEGVLRRPQPGGDEVNHEESNGVFVKLYENVTRNPELLIGPVPPYMAEKLALACAHDSLIVNGVRYGKQDGKVEITYFDEESDPLCHAQVQLRQVEFIAENSDDAGDVDVPQTVLGINGVLYGLNP